MEKSKQFMCSYHLSPLLCWARFSQGEDVAADRDLPPDAWFGVLAEAVARVHHQHAVGGQPVHLTIRCLPLSSFLLNEAKNTLIFICVQQPFVQPPIIFSRLSFLYWACVSLVLPPRALTGHHQLLSSAVKQWQMEKDSKNKNMGKVKAG